MTHPAPATRNGRDPFLDLLRVGALAVVVIWHWTFTSVAWTASGPRTDNPVAVAPWLWALTWIVQPMCVFFAVGGTLHSRDQRPALTFWKARSTRLVGPVVVLLAAAAAAIAAAKLTGRDDLVRVVVLAISPLWFLAVYLCLIVIAPAAKAAHRRFGAAVPVILIAAIAGVDAARFDDRIGGWPVTLGLFVLTWAFVHQVGFHLDRIRGHRNAAIAVAGVGLAGLVAASTFGPYPPAMVGSSADEISNMGPPNLMVAFLCLFQVGLLAALSPQLTRWAADRQSRLASLGNWTMPIYVWHLTAFCAFFALAYAVGMSNGTIDAGWWLARPVWFIGPALFCWGLLTALIATRVIADPRTGRRTQRTDRARSAARSSSSAAT